MLISLQAFGHEGDHYSIPERFLENKGQWHDNVKFKIEVDGGNLYLENNAFTYHFYELYNVHPHNPEEESGIKGHNFRMHFRGANPLPSFKTGKKSFTDYNYFYGKNPEGWVSGAKAYSFVQYQDIYKGIDLKIYDHEGFLKYDFLIESGADPHQIKMKYDGVNNIYISDGQLIIEHDLGMVTEQQPYAYQIIDGKKQEVNCKFLLDGTEISFGFHEGYDQRHPLIIDPTLIFSTFSGSKSDNWGMTATYDEFGNAYNGGTVFGPNYLIPTGGYDSTFNNVAGSLVTDVAIRKYSSDGSQIYFSTYLGGNGSEMVHSMIVNDQNELIVFGATSSNNFPMMNAYDSTFNGGNRIYALARFFNGTDIYVTKFSADGLSIEGSTYVGGSGNDGLNYHTLLGVDQQTQYGNLLYEYGDQARGEVELDQYGNIYIASQTHSSDFPIVNGLNNNLNGNQDAVLLKFSPDLSDLMYSSYFGGNGFETGISVKIDSNNNIFMAGGTTSNNFTTTTGAYMENYQGGISDGYIIKLDSAGQNLLASTFIGSSDYDQVFNLDVDRSGNPYLFAQNKGGGFPVINADYYIQNGGQLIGKLTPDLSDIVFSTKIGNKNNNGIGDGEIDITPTAFMVDRCQNLYISGWGGNIKSWPLEYTLSNMPITPDAFKSNTHGINFYIAVIKRNADSLLFATYFGGSNGSYEHVDGGTSRFDERGVVYQSVCAGCGGNNFITKDAIYPINGSANCNNAIFKFDLEILPKAKFSTSRDTGCAPMTVQFDDESLRANEFFWDFGNNDTTSSVKNPVRTFNQPGTYLVKLGVTDSICQSTDTAYKYIVVYPRLDSFTVSNDTLVCTMDSLDLFINSFGAATNFIWSSNRNFTDTLNSMGDSTVRVIPKGGTNSYYYIKAGSSLKNCSYTDSVWVKYMQYNPAFAIPPDSVCSPMDIEFKGQIIGATFYGYEFSDGSSYPMVQDLKKKFTESGNYHGFFTTENDICMLKDTFHFDIHVFEGIDVMVSNDTAICYGDSIIVKGNSFGNADQFIWSRDDDFSSPLNSINDSTIKISTSADRDTFYFKANNEFCADSTVFHLEMERVLMDIDGPKMLCLGDTATLHALDMSNVSPLELEWMPDPLIIAGQTTEEISTSPPNDTEFLLKATSALGCVDSAIHLLEVNEPTYNSADIIASQDTIYIGQSIILSTNLNDPNIDYQWLPADHLSHPNSETTNASPTETTDYEVEIYDPETGCTIKALKRIVVFEINCGEPQIFIPTAFSPNGDMNNDVFEVKGNVIEELSLSIYNRWGEKIFESFGQDHAWDGTYKGTKVDPGVFVYHLHLRCFDGQTFFKKGNITVIQ